jgi:hypothetical protein
VLEGKCSNCNHTYWGWALRDPDQRSCPNCGGILEIKDFESKTKSIVLPKYYRDRTLQKRRKKLPISNKAVQSKPDLRSNSVVSN